MKKIIYICDKCGKEIEGNPYRVTVDRLFAEPSEQEVKGIMSPHPYPDMDGLHFCKECVGALVDLIRCHLKPNTENVDTEPENTEEVATSQPDPPEKSPKRKLDLGKVRALRNAGWSIKAIAEETQYSDKAIYRALGAMGMPAGAKNAPEPKPMEQSTNN